MLTPNELMTWDQMVERYPGRWVFVEVTKGNATNFDEGVVRAVARDQEVEDAMDYCVEQGFQYTFQRTTVEPFMGILDSMNLKISEVVLGREG